VTGPHDFPFTAGRGDKVAARLTRVTFEHGTTVSILDVAGTVLTQRLVAGHGDFVDAIALPGPGRYRLRVEPAQPGDRGTFRVQVFVVPPDVTAEIQPGGPAVSIANVVPGQNMRLLFDGNAGHRVSWLTGLTGLDAVLTKLRHPTGEETGNAFVVTPGAFIDPQALATDGRYVIVLDPSGDQVGSTTVTLFDVPPDPTQVTSPGSKPFTMTTSVPGQNASFTFAGKQGQRVSMIASAMTMPDGLTATLVAPDGTNVTGQFLNPPGGFLDAQTLPQDGTYTMRLDPPSETTGSVTVRLFDVPADSVGRMKVGGQGVTLATRVPGQNMRVQLFGSPGTVTLHLSDMSVASVFVQALDADGKPTGDQHLVSAPGGDATLSMPGSSLVVLIDPTQDEVGQLTVSATAG
jgi:hypothetical protein